ncbi:MAG: DEAD/DEAH box helicase, partial [Treponema sp.]|nr:DEAD/DEAH box helicase [Treponema sp.]
MYTLSFPELLKKITGSRSVSALFSAVKEERFPIEIEGSEGAFTALLASCIYSAAKGQVFVIVPQENDSGDLALDLAGSGIPCMKFSWWGTAPYHELSPLSAVFGERCRVLSDLVLGKPGIFIFPQRALLTPLPPPEYIKSLLITLTPGGKIDTSALAATLVSYGYTRVPRVQVQGEFALRGEVLDIFMSGDEEAYRVLFDFDRIESIKQFDPALQGTGNVKFSQLVIRPVKEVVWTDERIEELEKNLASLKEFSDGGKAVIEELISRRTVQGEEMFYPLAFGKAFNLLDYLDACGTLLLLDRERLENMQESLEREYQGLYMRAKREGREYPLPERILLNFFDIVKFEKRDKKTSRRVVSFRNIKGEPEPHVCRIDLSCEPARSFFGNMDYLNEEFAAILGGGWQIAVAAESEVQSGRIKKILEPHESLYIMSTPLTAGFSLPDIKFMVVQENEIFGRRKRLPHSLKTARSRPIDTFVELNPGDYVVHVNHGIGLFKGIERLNALGHERDYIHLEYAEEENVFVPVEQVNLVQRYIGSEGQPPRLDVLGSKSWENRKNRVKKSVEDIAEKLIELYSKRRQAQGFAFGADTEWQTMFEAAFPFEETEDQLRCIQEIKQDMESPHPMDRLVCGDVGYGKTEVALRACFKAIMGGKQTAFLAPTTILAEQHYENFLERFSNFSVNVAMLS